MTDARLEQRLAEACGGVADMRRAGDLDIEEADWGGIAGSATTETVRIVGDPDIVIVVVSEGPPTRQLAQRLPVAELLQLD